MSIITLKRETLEDIEALKNSVKRNDFENALLNAKAIVDTIEYLLLDED